MSKRNITEAMGFAALANKYFIGKVTIGGVPTDVNQLQDAIEDGSIDALVVEAAAELHDGDLYRAYAEWSRVLSSTQTNLKKATSRQNIQRDWLQYNMLRDYVTKRMSELKDSTKSKRSGSGLQNKKSFWTWSIEEIEAIPLDDLKTAKSVYDAVADKKSKYPEQVLARYGDMGVYLAIFDAASAKYSACKKYAKEQASKVEVADSTLSKLSKGTKVTLSQAEAAELLELLKKLQG